MEVLSSQTSPYLVQKPYDITANPPNDIATLQTLLRASETRLVERDNIIVRKDDRIERLERHLADFKRALFGSKSEKVATDQYELALEDIETAIAAIIAEDEQDVGINSKPKEPRKTNRGSLPKHLPRVEEIIKPDSIIFGCG